MAVLKTRRKTAKHIDSLASGGHVEPHHEDVRCNNQSLMAIIDTGASLWDISLDLAKHIGLPVNPWTRYQQGYQQQTETSSYHLGA